MQIHVCVFVANGVNLGGFVGMRRAKARMVTFDSYFVFMVLRWYVCVLKIFTLFSVLSAHAPRPANPAVQAP